MEIKSNNHQSQFFNHLKTLIRMKKPFILLNELQKTTTALYFDCPDAVKYGIAILIVIAVLKFTNELNYLL